MKKILISVLAALFISGIFSLAVYALTGDSVVGVWLVPKQDAKIKIYKCGKKYCGKIAWLKVPGDLDTKNPDPAKRKNKLLDMVIMYGFNFDGEEWVGGHIYDPDEGGVYKCKMWLANRKLLKVKGYVGVSLIGRAENWTRVE